MDNNITVRKYKAERYCFRALVLALVLVMLFFIYPNLYGLLFAPVILLSLPILIYMESWQIVFSGNGIQKKCFFRTVQSYSYAALTDAQLSYSCTMNEYVTLTFSDNKCIRFRLKDENAAKALKRIVAHRSVRRVP